MPAGLQVKWKWMPVSYTYHTDVPNSLTYDIILNVFSIYTLNLMDMLDQSLVIDKDVGKAGCKRVHCTHSPLTVGAERVQKKPFFDTS